MLKTALTIALLLPSVLLAGPAATGKPSPMEELLDLSGAKRSFEQFPEQIDAQLSASKDPVPDSLRAAMKAAYSPAVLIGFALADLKASFDPEKVSAALGMLRSPIALKMTRLELEGTSPAVQGELAAFAQSVQTELPPPARMALVTRLDRLSGATEFSSRVAAGAAHAVMRGLLAARKAQAPPGITLATIEQKLKSELRNHVLISLLFCYRSASDADLEEYIKLLDSESGKSTVAALMRSAEAAFEGCARDLEKRLAAGGSAGEGQ